MIAGLVDGVLVAFGLCVVMLSLSACSAVLDSMQIFGSPAAFYACTLGASALLAWLLEPWMKRGAGWFGHRTGLFILGSPVKRVELFATQARPIAEPDGIDGAELDGPDPARCTFAVMRDEVVYGCRRRAEHQGLHANGDLRWGADKLIAIWDRNIFKQLLGALRAYLRKSVR